MKIRFFPCLIATVFFTSIFSFIPAVFAKEQTDTLLDPLKKLQAGFSDKFKKKSNETLKKPVAKESQIQGLRLEGVARGTQGGSDVAIFEGEPYRVGEEIKGERILEIQPSFIRIENITTHEKRVVWVNGKPSKQEMEAIAYDEESDVSSVVEPQLWNQKLSVWSVGVGLTKKQAVNKALIDLHRVRDAAQRMEREKAMKPKKISDLIQSHFLPRDFLKEQFFYHFSVGVSGIHADPGKKFSELSHFFLGDDNLIRFEKNTVASEASPVWNKDPA